MTKLNASSDIPQAREEGITRERLTSLAIDGLRVKIADIGYCLESLELDAEAVDKLIADLSECRKDLQLLEAMQKDHW